MALTVGQLAQRSVVPPTTLRYYDALGRPPSRSTLVCWSRFGRVTDHGKND